MVPSRSVQVPPSFSSFVQYTQTRLFPSCTGKTYFLRDDHRYSPLSPVPFPLGPRTWRPPSPFSLPTRGRHSRSLTEMDKMWKWPPSTHTDAGWDVDAGAASRECFSFMGRTVTGAEKGVPREDVGAVSTLLVSQRSGFLTTLEVWSCLGAPDVLACPGGMASSGDDHCHCTLPSSHPAIHDFARFILTPTVFKFGTVFARRTYPVVFFVILTRPSSGRSVIRASRLASRSHARVRLDKIKISGPCLQLSPWR